MQVCLHSPFRKAAFGAGCLLIIALYLNSAARQYLASRLTGASERSALERAVRLDPSDANHHYRLGRYLFFVANDLPGSILSYRAATALNPYKAAYWLDLASAYLVTGDLESQKQAIDRALQAEPTAPQVAWEAGNYLLIQGETERALAQFRVVLQNDPEMTAQALEQCWRATHDVDQILDRALPPTAHAHLGFLDLLVSKKETALANKVWLRLLGLGQHVEVDSVSGYLQHLLDQGEAERSRQVWRELVTVNPALAPYQPTENLVVNGGFEQKLLTSGLDWRHMNRTGVRVAIDPMEFRSGGRSLYIEFQGLSAEDAGVYQLIPVRPDTEYVFSAYIMTRDVESASGPRFMIQDAATRATLALTEDLLGSNAWRQQRADFKTGPATNLLLLRLVRVPAESLILGKVWIDELRLRLK